MVHCRTALTYCPDADGETDLKTRIIQCSIYDTTYRTIYVHSETHGHSHAVPIYDSHAFPALRASDVILDGSIDVPFGLVEYNGETFATIHDHYFVYMYVGDRDDSTWHGVDHNMWNAVLFDGTASSDACLTGVPPQSPPAPASPPTHPPVYYEETNATACPNNGPLTAEQCDEAYEVNIGPLPGSIHVVGVDHMTHPTGCIVDGGLYEYNSFSTTVPCSTTYPCLCHDPDNHTLASPIQPPAPPIAPPPPSPPLRPPGPAGPPPSSPLPPLTPPPYNVTEIGGIALNSTVEVDGWQFEVLILEDTKTRIYFEPGHAFEPEDFVVFVPKCAFCTFEHTHTPNVATVVGCMRS